MRENLDVFFFIQLTLCNIIKQKCLLTIEVSLLGPLMAKVKLDHDSYR